MKKSFLWILLVVILLAACSRPYSTAEPFIPIMPTYDPSADQAAAPDQSAPGISEQPVIPNSQPATQGGAGIVSAAPTANILPSPKPGEVITSPTPDQPKTLPTLRTKEEIYTVKPSDTLGLISRKYGVDVGVIMEVNKLTNANLISVGQKLIIPAPQLKNRGSSFKIIPDSELVLGPNTAGFSIDNFVSGKKGYLASYQETVDERTYTGVQVVERICREYSVNPRLMLAALEYQSGWVTRSNPPENRLVYPMGRTETYRKGLYKQLAWAANMLNRGYYLWRANGIATWQLADGSVVPIAPEINAGTAGVQHFLGTLYDRSNWDQAVSEKGLYGLYYSFFGRPFNFSFEPMLPAKLAQPRLQLPFEPGSVWSFTGGPHGGWGDGSAWAALDFAPPGDGGGCRLSNEWVVAMADGVILRSDLGAVVQDLDGDGDERTGWTILYMHIATSDRVPAGKRLKAGDPIGHPSCEGGVSNGTHTHVARRYNGEWIPADGPLPFNLDGWVSAGAGVEYYGSLTRNGQVLEPWDAKTDQNQIQR